MIKHRHAVDTMLKRTNGIYLRDNTGKASSMYNTFCRQGSTADQKNLEISRDQIIGQTAALYMIYSYVDESAAPGPGEKQKIKTMKQNINGLFSTLKAMFEKHETPFHYPLYNENENRPLGNFPNCWTFKIPLNIAFDHVLGNGSGGSGEDVSLSTLYSIIDRLAGPSAKAGFSGSKGDLFKKDGLFKGISISYFNWNLVMYWLLIAGTQDRSWAEVAIAFIMTFIRSGFKHLNLAALYCYLLKKWNFIEDTGGKIPGVIERDILEKFLNENKKILSHEWYLFPDTIIPCRLSESDPRWGSYWPVQPDTTWWWKYDSICQNKEKNLGYGKYPDDWCTPPPEASKTVDDIKEASKTNKIAIDCGLSLLFRNLLYNFA